MKAFLEIVANDIIEKIGNDLSRTAVIFPNKRASLFFNDALVKDRPIWSPTYLTISELFQSYSDLAIGDSIKMICDLYQIYKTCTGSTEELDHFFSWGQLMISDFDDIDKSMADARQIFKNIANIHELDSLEYLTAEQKELLQRFFSSFNGAYNSNLKNNFLRIWDKIGEIYNLFRENLRAQNIGYEGMIYRDVVENENIKFDYDHYVFVGFNVLQTVEYSFLRKIQATGKALFYWDIDKYYLDIKEPNNKWGITSPGYFIRQYIRNLPSAIDLSSEVFDNMSKNKSITFLSSTTENIQAHYVTTWLKDNDRYKDGNRTAIVMCDENLLQSIIYCVPDEVTDINITSGYPLGQSAVASLISLLMSLQTVGWSNRRNDFLRRQKTAVERHPYIQQFFTDEERKDIIYKHIIETENTPIVKNINSWLIKIICKLKIEDNFNREALYRCYTILNRLQNIINEGSLNINLNTYRRLVNQIISQTSVPFHGEPAIGVQIMGVLETRNLDFKHLLLLSCNDSNMPNVHNDTSFIPYNIRKAFGLTTPEKKVALYSYYFYRLLQRCEDISIAYNNSTEDGKTGEKSQFMLQMMVDGTHDIKFETLQARNLCKTNNRPTINKSNDIMATLYEIFSEKISPSALNRYLRCPLQYYYNYVKGIKEPDEEDEDELSNIKFGTIFHEVAEKLYKPYEGQVITESIISDIDKKQSIESLVDESMAKNLDSNKKGIEFIKSLSGIQLISREVIVRYLKNMLIYDKKFCPFRIIEVEKKLKKEIEVISGDKTITVSLGGTADRIDEISYDNNGYLDKKIRVVDYKTGVYNKDKLSMPDIESIFNTELVTKKHCDYFLQTFFYCCLVSERVKDTAVSPSLLFIQHALAENYDITLKINKEQVNDISTYSNEFMQRLKLLIEEILDPDKPFSPTTDLTRCDNCPWENLCRKK